jgi:hypothetical protein
MWHSQLSSLQAPLKDLTLNRATSFTCKCLQVCRRWDTQCGSDMSRGGVRGGGAKFNCFGSLRPQSNWRAFSKTTCSRHAQSVKCENSTGTNNTDTFYLNTWVLNCKLYLNNLFFNFICISLLQDWDLILTGNESGRRRMQGPDVSNS